MHTIGLAAYTMRIRRKNVRDSFETLGENGDRHSLGQYFVSYLESISAEQAVDTASQVVLRSRDRVEDDDVVRGFLLSGEYGFEAQGINVQTNAASYTRTQDDAETIPFHYRCYLPDEKTTSVLLVQRHGGRGVLTVFARGFSAYLKDECSDHVLEMSRLVPAAVVRELTQGRLHAIRIKTHVVPNDLADKFRAYGRRGDIGTIVLEARARRDRSFRTPRWLRNIREGRVAIAELPFDIDSNSAEIKITLAYRGKERVVNVTRLTEVAPYTDVTGDVMIVSGHPTPASIADVAARLMEELIEQIDE